ncbi:MAG: hypothetical protein Q3M30_16335 [Candidatus Electrothrix sp. Rat3]|nr:hypothetical protein [Candidatus Electrothrix rattekaaiensis]
MKVYIAILFFLLLPLVANADDSKNVDKAISFLHAACVTGGEKVTFEVNGVSGITLQKWKENKIEGEVSFKREELKGITGELTEFSLMQAQDIRDCMKPHIKKIIDFLLDSPNMSKKDKQVKRYLASLINEIRLTVHVNIPLNEPFFDSIKKDIIAFNDEMPESPSMKVGSIQFVGWNTINHKHNYKLYSKLENLIRPFFNYAFIFYKNSDTPIHCLEAREECKPDMFFQLMAEEDIGKDGIQYSIRMTKNDNPLLQVSIEKVYLKNFAAGLEIQSLDDLRGSIMYITGPTGLRPSADYFNFFNNWNISRLIIYTGRGLNLQVSDSDKIKHTAYETGMPRDQWNACVWDWNDFEKGAGKIRMRIDKIQFPKKSEEFVSLINSML